MCSNLQYVVSHDHCPCDRRSYISKEYFRFSVMFSVMINGQALSLREAWRPFPARFLKPLMLNNFLSESGRHQHLLPALLQIHNCSYNMCFTIPTKCTGAPMTSEVCLESSAHIDSKSAPRFHINWSFSNKILLKCTGGQLSKCNRIWWLEADPAFSYE